MGAVVCRLKARLSNRDAMELQAQPTYHADEQMKAIPHLNQEKWREEEERDEKREEEELDACEIVLEEILSRNNSDNVGARSENSGT